MNGSFICPNGGPHYFIGGDRCVCGATEGYVFTKRSEHERLTSDFAAAQALAESQRLALATMREALSELLESHDNLYVAHFGDVVRSGVRPEDDIAAKPARAILDQPGDAAALAGAVLEAADRRGRALDALVLGDATPVEAHAMLDAYRRARSALRGDGAVEG